MNCLSRREFTKRAAGGVAAAFSSVVPVDGLTTAKRAAGGTEKIDLAILMLPEVLPPWEHFDYDVREQYLHSGASNLTYVVRHLENLCHNLGLSVRRAQIDGLGNLHNMVLLVPDASRMLPETRAALDKWIIQDKPVIVF